MSWHPMRRPAADPLAGAAELATPGAWLAFATELLEKTGVALGQVATFVGLVDYCRHICLKLPDGPQSQLRRQKFP